MNLVILDISIYILFRFNAICVGTKSAGNIVVKIEAVVLQWLNICTGLYGSNDYNISPIDK